MTSISDFRAVLPGSCFNKDAVVSNKTAENLQGVRNVEVAIATNLVDVLGAPKITSSLNLLLDTYKKGGESVFSAGNLAGLIDKAGDPSSGWSLGAGKLLNLSLQLSMLESTMLENGERALSADDKIKYSEMLERGAQRFLSRPDHETSIIGEAAGDRDTYKKIKTVERAINKAIKAAGDDFASTLVDWISIPVAKANLDRYRQDNPGKLLTPDEALHIASRGKGSDAAMNAHAALLQVNARTLNFESLRSLIANSIAQVDLPDEQPAAKDPEKAPDKPGQYPPAPAVPGPLGQYQQQQQQGNGTGWPTINNVNNNKFPGQYGSATPNANSNDNSGVKVLADAMLRLVDGIRDDARESRELAAKLYERLLRAGNAKIIDDSPGVTSGSLVGKSTQATLSGNDSLGDEHVDASTNTDPDVKFGAGGARVAGASIKVENSALGNDSAPSRVPNTAVGHNNKVSGSGSLSPYEQKINLEAELWRLRPTGLDKLVEDGVPRGVEVDELKGSTTSNLSISGSTISTGNRLTGLDNQKSTSASSFVDPNGGVQVDRVVDSIVRGNGAAIPHPLASSLTSGRPPAPPPLPMVILAQEDLTAGNDNNVDFKGLIKAGKLALNHVSRESIEDKAKRLGLVTSKAIANGKKLLKPPKPRPDSTGFIEPESQHDALMREINGLRGAPKKKAVRFDTSANSSHAVAPQTLLEPTSSTPVADSIVNLSVNAKEDSGDIPEFGMRAVKLNTPERLDDRTIPNLLNQMAGSIELIHGAGERNSQIKEVMVALRLGYVPFDFSTSDKGTTNDGHLAEAHQIIFNKMCQKSPSLNSLHESMVKYMNDKGVRVLGRGPNSNPLLIFGGKPSVLYTPSTLIETGHGAQIFNTSTM